ncbi:COG0675 Transposase and inactivated derivatives [uncultured Caudovirales phage]|uniref:COG0675 Transposase and inactivated derivatives n=1 Tax=uncultured Caudovirales phage TaxID=2100421 RepID=A0A6J5LE87_9CAUD|nr:COG0675 Transposase and inactivated derivatives [uncultured Caudovirales phage]
MQQMKAFKYRIYPNAAQCQQLSQFFGAKRWVYNHFLAIQKQKFLNKEKHLSNFDMNYLITDLKKQAEYSWLNEVDSIALQNATEDLANSYSNFFKSIRGQRKGKKMELPRFKKRSNQQSYRTRGIKITEQGLKLPKIKSHININLHRPITGTIKSATISKTPSGKYYISILCEADVALMPQAGREVGIDLGLKDLAILSNGIKFDHPGELLAKTTLQLKKAQRKLSRKKKDSKNYEEQRVVVAAKYAKITAIRNDYYHKLSHYLVSNYDAIYVEDLNVAGMIKNRKLSRKIAESSWSTLSSMIEYKCNWYGKTYYRISRWTPTSKTCSNCGHKLEKLDLNTRAWTCPSCGTKLDRDINAAINIKHTGQRDLYNQIISDATPEMGAIPVALQKVTSKIERSDSCNQLVMGVGKPKSLQLLGS